MATEVKTKNVEIRSFYEDKVGNRVVDAVVLMEITSNIGKLDVSVPVDGSHGTDHAIQDAREILRRWAQGVAEALRSGYPVS